MQSFLEKRTLAIKKPDHIKIKQTEDTSMNKVTDTAFKGIAVAMGIAVIVLSILGTLSAATGNMLLGIGLAALAINSLKK